MDIEYSIVGSKDFTSFCDLRCFFIFTQTLGTILEHARKVKYGTLYEKFENFTHEFPESEQRFNDIFDSTVNADYDFEDNGVVDKCLENYSQLAKKFAAIALAWDKTLDGEQIFQIWNLLITLGGFTDGIKPLKGNVGSIISYKILIAVIDDCTLCYGEALDRNQTISFRI